jgi:hypothetical protein
MRVGVLSFFSIRKFLLDTLESIVVGGNWSGKSSGMHGERGKKKLNPCDIIIRFFRRRKPPTEGREDFSHQLGRLLTHTHTHPTPHLIACSVCKLIDYLKQNPSSRGDGNELFLSARCLCDTRRASRMSRRKEMAEKVPILAEGKQNNSFLD